MSVKLQKRLSSKKKKPLKENAQAEVLHKLGLEAFWTKPLEPASMLDISTWNLENQTPLETRDLPNAFLQRLWLLSPDARSPCCTPQNEALTSENHSSEEIINGTGAESHCEINPLDLVSAVFMSSNSFLQHEMIVRMVQCQFAVPLVLPDTDPEEPSHYLLWPLRGVLSQWWSNSTDMNRTVQEGDLASTHIPLISCVKLGHCSVSKSQLLNSVIGGEVFLHRGMDGGQLPRRLANGLIETGWYLPTGDKTSDIFPVPVVISNLRGDASAHQKHFSLLCQISSAVVVFCGDLKEKEKQLLSSCKHTAEKLILVDLSDYVEYENRVVGFEEQNLCESFGLPEGAVLQGSVLTERELVCRLSETIQDLLRDKLKLVTLEAAAKLAEESGLSVDEGAVCKKAGAKVEEVLQGLDNGSSQYKKEQLPLQGYLWRKLARIEKEEKRLRKESEHINSKLQNDKREILVVLSSYKMTPAMKVFTDVLFTADSIERSCFLTWMKLKLFLMQKQNVQTVAFTGVQTDRSNGLTEYSEETENVAEDIPDDSDSFCTDSTFDDEETEGQLGTELEVSGQQTGMEHIVQTSMSTEEPQLQQKDNPESTPDAVMDLQISNESNLKNEDQASFNSEIADSHPAEQNIHLHLRENGICQEEETEELHLTSAESGSASSQQQHSLDDSSDHQAAKCSQPFQPDPSWLGLEHFLREMGLIFELTHISPGSGSHNVLRLPSLAVDLLLYGVPLELMDGDASNIPIRWLACVFAELNRRLPQDRSRTRVLTSLGVHHAKNAEVLTALFGVKFPEGRKRSTRGLYMAALCLPDYLREEMECDFLLLIDAEGLCSKSLGNKGSRLIHDNEMATVATGLTDVLMHNISSEASAEYETNFTVIANALLRIRESESIPLCQLLTQDDGLNATLQTLQLQRVSEILQTETGDQRPDNADHHSVKTPCTVTYVKGPWNNIALSQPVDSHYSEALIKLKQNLFGALKRCEAKSKATGLPEFFNRLCAVWDAVKDESSSISLDNTDTALAFSLLCTELSQWKDRFLEHMENWLTEPIQKICATKTKAQDATIQNDLLSELKSEAREEIKAEVDKIRLKVDSYVMKNDLLKTYPFKPILMRNLDELQERVAEEIEQKLDTVTESHCSTTQLERFETLLGNEKHSKLEALLENSKSTKVLLEDAELEEEFEGVWTKTMSSFDFRPSETDDITARVTDILRENLTSRGLLKHMKKLEDISKNPASTFQVYDEHFGYRSRLKHMFEDNNRLQRVEAQDVARNIIEEYDQFVAAKSSLTADFSNSYITELLETVENKLQQKSMEIRSAFEVDLKVYLCSCACRDFQKLHDRFAKDTELLMCITANKTRYMAQFIYQFRKRDQCRRMAEAFTSMVIKPTVLDYIYGPLGKHIAEEIRESSQQFHSPCDFHERLLEELLQEDSFESFLEYLHSYDDFSMKTIKKAVLAHLSDKASLNKWRQNRLGDIVGKIASAISQTLEGTSGVLSDTNMLLERVCLTLEKDGDVEVTRAPLDGPLFSITTEWDHFVKCLMELLAVLRLELAQEFSQNVDSNQLLQSLPVQPQDSLFNRVRGCGTQCPCCRAPCDLTKMEHEVHRAVLHRPKGTVPHNPSSPSCTSCSGSMAEENADQSKDTQRVVSSYPDWSISAVDPDNQTPFVYWRYVLARFNARFAQEYEQELAEIPEDWKTITAEEALNSMKETFLSAKYCH